MSDPEIIEFAGTPTVVVRREALPLDELVDFMDEAFTALGEAIRDGVFTPSGPGFARYDTQLTKAVTLEVGFPVGATWGSVHKVGDVVIEGSELPAGTTAVARHKGDYDEIVDSWHEVLQSLEERGYRAERPFWEYYDVPPVPGREPERYRTRLAAPVRKG